MGTLSYVIIDAADPLPSAAQIMAGLSGTGAPAIHAGQRSILCGRDAIAQELIDKYGAGVWFDAADAQFGGAQALESGLVDALPNRLDRVERVHAVGHMGASWMGGGNTPPTVDGSATHMGADCVSATFAVADYGSTAISGYGISRAWPWGDDTYKYIVTQGTRVVIKARIAVSRDLQSGEAVILRSGGGGGLAATVFEALQAGQWYELVANAGSYAPSGGYLNALNVHLRGDHSTPLTVYMQEHTIWEYSDSSLSQATTSQQPRFVRASNGMPAIQGDGVDDYLAGDIALPGTSLWSVAVFESPAPFSDGSGNYSECLWNTVALGASGNKGRAHTLYSSVNYTDPRSYIYAPVNGASSSGNTQVANDSYPVATGRIAIVAIRRGGNQAGGGYYTLDDGSKRADIGRPALIDDNNPERQAFHLLTRASKDQYFRGKMLGQIIGNTAISDADLSDLYDLAAAYYKVI